MGLYKPMASDNGTVTRYHRIEQVYLKKDGTVDILVYSYASRAYRDDELIDSDHTSDMSISQKFYFSNIGKPSITYEEAYDLLKEMEEFADSIDVLEDEEESDKLVGSITVGDLTSSADIAINKADMVTTKEVF